MLIWFFYHAYLCSRECFNFWSNRGTGQWVAARTRPLREKEKGIQQAELKQAEKAKISQEDMVSQLIPLLPSDIAEIIVKQPAELGDDFQHVKKVLLNRFRLGTGALTP